MWEHIPDGEPYVFEDPDQPGKYRVYIYGSHDSRITDYCGREQVVWSASVDSLNNWRYDGVILAVSKNAKGEFINEDSLADVLFAPDVTLVTDKNGRKTYYLYPNDQHGGRNGLIAKSDRPDGPFATGTRRIRISLMVCCSLTLVYSWMTTVKSMAIGALDTRWLRSLTQPLWLLSNPEQRWWTV